MATMQENLARFQEISNRGLQDRLPPEIRSRFDEAVNRGLLQQAAPQPEPPQPELRPEQAATPIEQDFIPTGEALAAAPAQRPPEPTLGEEAVGGLDVAKTIVSSAVAEPIAGLAGLITSPFVDQDKAVRNIEAVRNFVTLEPSTEEGKRNLKVVGDLVNKGVDLANIPASGLVGLSELLTGQGVEQAAESVERVKTEGLGNVLGDRILEETGSPELAAIAFSAPTAAIELLGLKGLRSSTIEQSTRLSGSAKKALKQAAPSINQLKNSSRSIYKELDKSGVKIKDEVFQKFIDKLDGKLKKEGLRKRQHPKAFDALQAVKEESGKPVSFSDLNSLRQTASDAASNFADPADARIGRIILNEVDNGIDRLADIAGKDARGARALWRRAKVAESISGMMEDASLAASGLENGLRIEARKILKSKKKGRGFSKDELKALRELEQGSTAANAAKFLGKFGISEGKATSMLGSAIGGQIGSQLAGAPGAAAALTLGQLAKNTAQRLTAGKAKFADQLIRGGGDGRAITRAYLKNTAASQRNVNDLTQLLLDPNITPESISKLNFKLKVVDDAKFFANEIKRRSQQAASAAAITQPKLGEEE